MGILCRDSKQVEGRDGAVIDTPLGRFKYLTGDRYNRGWLNTLAYDRPVRF